MADINERYDALLPGVDPAYGVLVAKQDVIGKALYMLKAPQSEHRVYPKRTEKIDPETGEITTPTTGRFKQRKRPLRPCDMVRMCNVLADKCLDRLLFAGGDGAKVVGDIRTEALKPLRDYERSRPIRHAHVQEHSRSSP